MPLFLPGRAAGDRLLTRASLLVAVLVLFACSPTFNWREMRPQGTPLQALMPCKPEHAVRTVPLAGAVADLHMHSCDTGGLSFAVAWVELGDVVRADAALDEWPRASLATLRLDPALAGSTQARWDFQLSGAPKAKGLLVQGTGPQGQPMRMQAAYFARGSQVFQAAVYGPCLPADATNTFFEGLRMP